MTQLFRHVAERTLLLRLSSGEQIEATPEHPFYVQDKGFRPAKVLAAGMILATLSQPVKVEAVTPVEKSQTVYNFAVDKTHTYFVGNSSVWVHNDCALRVNLRVVLRSIVNKADVTLLHGKMTADEVKQLEQVSSYTGRKVFSERIPFTPGFDGWLDKADTGLKLSLKGTQKSVAKAVEKEVARAKEKAEKANIIGEKIAVFVDAPNVDAKDLLEFLTKTPNSPLNLIPGNNDALNKNIIGNVTVFCKNKVIVHLDAP